MRLHSEPSSEPQALDSIPYTLNPELHGRVGVGPEASLSHAASLDASLQEASLDPSLSRGSSLSSDLQQVSSLEPRNLLEARNMKDLSLSTPGGLATHSVKSALSVKSSHSLEGNSVPALEHSLAEVEAGGAGGGPAAGEGAEGGGDNE